jgi:hypothetical protein
VGLEAGGGQSAASAAASAWRSVAQALPAPMRQAGRRASAFCRRLLPAQIRLPIWLRRYRPDAVAAGGALVCRGTGRWQSRLDIGEGNSGMGETTWNPMARKCSDISTVWVQAHIAVPPSRREGLPVSLLEAASRGRLWLQPMVPAAVKSNVTVLTRPSCRQMIFWRWPMPSTAWDKTRICGVGSVQLDGESWRRNFRTGESVAKCTALSRYPLCQWLARASWV